MARDLFEINFYGIDLRRSKWEEAFTVFNLFLEKVM